MAKLVAYYSRAGQNYFGGEYRVIEVGNTEKVAKKIAKITGADLFKLEQVTPYSSDYQTCINEAKKDLNNNERPQLVSLPDLDKYDEIYLGYPNYWSHMPMAVYTFLESFEWNGKTIHPFCTHEGSGLAMTEHDIKKEAEGAVVTKGLAIHGSHVDEAGNVIEKWCAANK